MRSLEGQRFGYLTAVEKLDKWEEGEALWKCRCICGNEIEVTASRLTQWNVTNCGCKTTMRNNASKLAGQKFGKLTVLYPTEERRARSTVWHCRCDCGRVKDVTARSLNTGGVKSCGCMVGQGRLS